MSGGSDWDLRWESASRLKKRDGLGSVRLESRRRKGGRRGGWVCGENGVWKGCLPGVSFGEWDWCRARGKWG